MSSSFDALDNDSQLAIRWKARQNLAMTLASGNSMAQDNQKKFLENNCESLASNVEGLKYIIQEYKEDMMAHADDD